MKTPAANERFYEIAAVTPQKRQCRFERLYPAGSLVGRRHLAKPLGR